MTNNRMAEIFAWLWLLSPIAVGGYGGWWIYNYIIDQDAIMKPHIAYPKVLQLVDEDHKHVGWVLVNGGGTQILLDNHRSLEEDRSYSC